MLFDKLCGIVENNWPSMVPVLEQTKLFILPARPQDVLEKEISDYNATDNFFLPFPMIAIEDKAGLTILIDTLDNQIGIDKPRKFIDVIDLDNDPDNFDSKNTSFPEYEIMKSKIGNEKVNAIVISFGTIEELRPNGKEKFQFSGSVSSVFIISENKILGTLDEIPEGIKKQMIIDGSIRNAGVAYQEVMYFNSPKRFIVEKSKTKIKKYKKIQRSHQRPTYTLLYPHEIRNKLSIDKPRGERKAPESHYRRRHYRTFKSDCFKNAKGKTIIISAKWIGPSEKVIGNKRYKIMLDI